MKQVKTNKVIGNIIVKISKIDWLSGVMLLFCIVSLYGCASSSNRQQLDRDKINRLLLNNADNAAADARGARLGFLDCVKRYATKNTQASASATEIAEAAVSNCELYLMDYERSNVIYHSSMGKLSVRSLDEIDRAEDKAQYKARIERQELIDSGRSAAIKALIDTKK